MKLRYLSTATAFCLSPVSSALASDGLNSGDTAWVIVATALVMMMTPAGLALFSGGMARYKNLLNTFAMTMVAYCLTSVIWMIWGSSIAFGPDVAGFKGSLANLFIRWDRRQQPAGQYSHLCFRSFPDDLCLHHRCSGAGFDCRSLDIFILDCVCGSLGNADILPGCPLGVGRRLDGQYGSP